MPRPQGKVWKYFQMLSENNGKKHAICMYCNMEYKHASATRMTEHLKYKCEKCPSDVKDSITKDSVVSNSTANQSQNEVYLDEDSDASDHGHHESVTEIKTEAAVRKESVDTKCEGEYEITTKTTHAQSETEFAIFGQLVACKIQKLSKSNRLIAQKRILGILFDLEAKETGPDIELS